MEEKTPEKEEEEVYPAEEQGIEQEPRSSEEIKEDMEEGEKEGDVYSAEGREQLGDDSEMSPAEQGFMEGEEEKGELGTCAHCGKILGDREEIVEKEIKGKKVNFCSEKCATSGTTPEGPEA
jgi:hypothetical protein